LDHEVGLGHQDEDLNKQSLLSYMDYVHIPVDFDNPTLEEFEDFPPIMDRDGNTRTMKRILALLELW